MKKYLVISMSMLCLVSGCASNQLSSEAEEAEAAVSDNRFAHLPPINDAEFSSLWTVKKRVDPGYSIYAASNGLSGCVTLSLVVNSEGKAVAPEITDAFPEDVFDKLALKAIKQWQWQATDANTARQPARTEVKFDFMVQDTQNKVAAEAHCNITIPSFH